MNLFADLQVARDISNLNNETVKELKQIVKNDTYTPVIEYPLLIILLIIEVDNFRCVAILTCVYPSL